MSSDAIHLGGLVSGTDYQGLIDQLLAVRRRPIDQLEEKQLDIQTNISAWSDINTDLSALTESLDVLRDFDTWNGMSTTVSDASKLTASSTSAAISATYSINITQLAQTHSVASDQAATLTGVPTATSASNLVAAGVLTAGDQFVIEGQTITIAASESMDSLVSQINTAAGSMAAADKVQATIVDNRLTITRVNAGSTQIAMSETVGTALQDLQIFSAPATYKAANEMLAAQDANFTVNGANVTRSSNANLTDVIAGVTLNLLDETVTPVTLTIGQNTETAKNAILDFIEKYNAAANKLTSYGQITLTGNDPSGATLESVGLLSNDPLVASILNNMRQQVTDSKYPDLNPLNATYNYNGVDEIMDTLNDIGVWTTGKANQIEVDDEARLDYMLSNYFDEVEQLFRGVFVAGTGYTHGVAADFYEYSENVTESMTGEIARHTQTMTDQSDDIGAMIEEMLKKLEDYEQELWEQFTAMEDAIADMQAQMSYLSAQMGQQQKK